MSDPMKNIRIEGRVKQRKLRPKPQYEKLIANLEEKGLRDLIKAEWFDTVYEDKEWTNNLITTLGLTYLKGASSLNNFWRCYQFGTGSVAPTLSSTLLSNYSSYCSTELELPDEYQANEYDYENGRVIMTRTWLSSVINSSITITEGGFSAEKLNKLYSNFLLETPVALELGDYYSPIYQLVISLSPSLEPQLLSSPFLIGANVSASAQLESLLCLIPPLNRNGQVSCASNHLISGNGSSYDVLFSGIGLENIYFSLYYSNEDSIQSSEEYYNIISDLIGWTGGGMTSLMWPSSGSAAGGYNVYGPKLYLVFSTDQTPLNFTENGHIMDGILGAYPITNTTIGAGSGYISYSDQYATAIRQVFDGNHGNHEGIRSIAWCIKESPVGSTEWRYRSLYRILLDEPITKETGKILTLDFKRSWA